MKKLVAMFAAGIGLFAATSAMADQPRPWEWRFQAPATEIMENIEWFERYTLWFIVPITLLVLALIGYCIVRFRASVNPNPSRTSHNTMVEVVWTVAPILVLICIAIPSFQLLTAEYTPTEEPAVTVKATGNQWWWDYEYQQGDQPLAYSSYLLQEVADIKKAKPDTADADIPRIALGKTDLAEYPRLLAVDNELVVPVNEITRVLVTSGDVIHAFAMPSFGVKADAVPGRINEVWFKPMKTGLYYGQCSELCGKDHAFMPIGIRVVTKEQFDAWMAAAKTNVTNANKALEAQIDAASKVASAAN